MKTISERIDFILNSAGVKKTDAARRLSLSNAFISELCSGKKAPSDRTISDICREFDVNETWLRTGEGEMIVARSVDDEIADYVSLILGRRDMDLQRKIISLMSKIPPETWGVIVAKAQEVFSSGDEGKKKEEEQT